MSSSMGFSNKAFFVGYRCRSFRGIKFSPCFECCSLEQASLLRFFSISPMFSPNDLDF